MTEETKDSTGPPVDDAKDLAGETLIHPDAAAQAEPQTDATAAASEPEVPEAIPETPKAHPITVATGWDHVIGLVKENDQDYVDGRVIDYPLHGYRVVIATGADGIGGGSVGERWSQSTVDLFLGAMGPRLPAFDKEDTFVDREQFWQLLKEKVQMAFFPSINWVTGCVYAFGLLEVGQKMENNQPTGKPAKTFGATWVATVTICDLKNGRGIVHYYCVGDPSLFLVTPGQIEKLNEDHSWKDGPQKGSLSRWVGQGQQANGQMNSREFEFDPEKLPYVHLVMCSDGLTNMVSQDETADEVRKEADPERAVHNLIDRAINVETPYGQQIEPDKDPPITPGDDNIFVGIVTIRIANN